MVLRNVKEKEHFIDIPAQCTAQGDDLLIRCLTNEKTLETEKAMTISLPSIASVGGRWNFHIYIVDVGKNSDKCNIIIKPHENDDIFGFGEIVIKTKGQGMCIFIADVNDWRGWQIM